MSWSLFLYEISAKRMFLETSVLVLSKNVENSESIPLFKLTNGVSPK